MECKFKGFLSFVDVTVSVSILLKYVNDNSG